MATIEEMLVRIEAESTLFRAELQKANAAVSAFQRSVDSKLGAVDKRFEGLGKSITGSLHGLVAGYSAGFFLKLGKDALEAAGHIGEAAEQVGVSAKTLQVLRFAAGQAGATVEELDNGLAFFSKTIGEAASGTKSAIDAFNNLGVKILDANGKLRPTEDILNDVADALQGIPDPANRAARAKELLGKAGQKLIPILSQGARGLSDYAKAAEKLGLVLSDDLIKQADKAADNLTAIKQVVSTAFTVGVVEAFAGSLDDMSGSAKGAADAAKELGTSVGTVLGKISEFFQYLAAHPIIAKILFGAGIGAFAGPEGALVGGATSGALAVIEEIAGAATRAVPEVERLQQAINELEGRKAGTTGPRGGKVLPSNATLAAIDAQIADLKGQLKEAEREANTASKLASGATPTRTTGASNPKPTGTVEAERKKREEALASIQAYIAGLEQETKALGMESAEKDRFLALAKAEEIARKGNVQLTQRDRDRIVAATDAQTDFNTALAARNEIEEVYQEIAADAKAIHERNKTALESYNEQLDLANKLYAAGAISATDYGRETRRLADELNQTTDAAFDFTEGMKDAGSVISTAFEDALTNLKSIDDILQGLATDIRKILARVLITKPLENAIETAISQSTTKLAPGDKGYPTQKNDLFGTLFGGAGKLFGIGGGKDGKAATAEVTAAEATVTAPVTNLAPGSAITAANAALTAPTMSAEIANMTVNAANVTVNSATSSGSGGGGSGDFLGQALALFGGSSGGEGMSATEMQSFGGPKAAGGDVNPNMRYLVGESGPEMFVPKVAGSIVPNKELGRGREGHTVNVYYQGPSGSGSSQARMTGAQVGRAVLSGLAAGRRIS